MHRRVHETLWPYFALFGLLCDCQGIYKNQSLSLPTNFMSKKLIASYEILVGTI